MCFTCERGWKGEARGAGGLGVCLGGCLGLGLLMEVRAHILLKVEVRQLVLRVELEEFSEFGVGDNLATVLLILEVMCADVGVNLASDVSAGHLRTLFLVEEGGEFFADGGGLDEAAGRASGALLAKFAVLMHSLEFLVHKFLDVLELALEGVGLNGELLKSRIEVDHNVAELATTFLHFDFGLGCLGGRCDLLGDDGVL